MRSALSEAISLGAFFVPKTGGNTMKEIHQSSIMEPTGEPPVIGSIHSIPLSAIHPMPNNPFQVRDDPAMNELVESISQFGMLVPVEVRPTEYGDYEMISGSRRHHACAAAGLDSVPAIILVSQLLDIHSTSGKSGDGNLAVGIGSILWYLHPQCPA